MARTLPEPRLTVITDETLGASALIGVMEAALKGGCRLIQLRHRRTPARELLVLAHQLRRMTRGYGACLIINDRLDIALEVEADGVHLPAAGMEAATVRRLVGERVLIGRSVHSLEETEALVHDEVDYVHFGPIYTTDSKRTFGRPQGLHRLAEAVCAAEGLPVIAVGGIDAGKAGEIVRAGAWGAAVIGAVNAASDPEVETARLLSALAARPA